jgi:CRISPR-associated protein Cmr4
MHVGSGEANYGVVDNLVQRDPITEIPIIHSSSLKGALREHFKDEWKNGVGLVKLNYVFGTDPIRNGGETEVGYYKFFDANLIVLPVRSNIKPFFRSTSKFLLDEINQKAKELGLSSFDMNPFNGNDVIKGNPKVLNGNNDCYLEDFKAQSGLSLKASVTSNLGENSALFHEDDFKELSKHLPVIARNRLENGESKNLWYEEVVPRESRFVFFVSKPKENETVLYESEFDIKIQNEVIQIGGNASIGYGYTKIKKLS